MSFKIRTIFKYETQLIMTDNYDTTQLNTRQKVNTNKQLNTKRLKDSIDKINNPTKQVRGPNSNFDINGPKVQQKLK